MKTRIILLTFVFFAIGVLHTNAQDLDMWGGCLRMDEITSYSRSGSKISIQVVDIHKDGWHFWKDNIILNNETNNTLEFQILFRIARTKKLSSKNKLGTQKRSQIYKIYVVMPPHSYNNKVLDEHSCFGGDYMYYFGKLCANGCEYGVELIDYHCRPKYR